MEKIKLTYSDAIRNIINDKQLKTIIIETGDENVYIPNENKFIVTKKFLINTSALFCSCNKLESINMENFDFSEIKTMKWWFIGCENLTEVIFPKFANLNNLKTLRGCFSDTAIREIDLSFMQSTDKAIDFLGAFAKSKIQRIILPKCTIKNFEECFSQCNYLEKVIAPININLSVEDVLWKTFKDCNSLQLIDLSDGNFNIQDFVNILQDKENSNNISEDCIVVLP